MREGDELLLTFDNDSLVVRVADREVVRVRRRYSNV